MFHLQGKVVRFIVGSTLLASVMLVASPARAVPPPPDFCSLNNVVFISFPYTAPSTDQPGTVIIPAPSAPLGNGQTVTIAIRLISYLGSDTWNADFFYIISPCSPDRPIFKDGRINPDANATVVGYCSTSNGARDGGLDVYNPANTHKLFHVTLAELKAAMDKAADLGHAIVIKQAEGQQLWALPTYEFKFVNGTAKPFLYYSAVYAGDYCGKGLSS